MKNMKRNKSTIFFFAIMTLFSMTCSFAHPVTPSLFKQLELADYMFGVSLACMSFGNLLFSPVWGTLIGYRSSRSIMLVCCIGYGIGQLCFVLCRSVLAVVLVRFLTGVFVGGIFVATLTYVVNTAENEQVRGRHLVCMATIEGVFNSVGYFVGGMLGEISITVAVLVQAACLTMCGILFRLVCRDDAKPELGHPQGRKLVKQLNVFRAFAQGKPFIGRLIALLFAVCALQNFSQTCFDQSFNYYVIDQIGLSTGYNGAIKGVMGLVTLLANSTICAWLMRKTDVKKSLIAVLFLCSITMSVILLMKDLISYLILNVVFYAMSAISIPMIQSLAASEGTRSGYDGNLVMSFYNALKNLGGIIGALLAGFTYMVTPKTPFVCCVLGFLCAGVCAMIYALRVKKGAREHA